VVETRKNSTSLFTFYLKIVKQFKKRMDILMKVITKFIFKSSLFITV